MREFPVLGKVVLFDNGMKFVAVWGQRTQDLRTPLTHRCTLQSESMCHHYTGTNDLGRDRHIPTVTKYCRVKGKHIDVDIIQCKRAAFNL